MEDYEQDICFMFDYDKVYIHAVRLRVLWIKPLENEVNIDDTKDIVKALLNEFVGPKATYFGTYNEEKARIDAMYKR